MSNHATFERSEFIRVVKSRQTEIITWLIFNIGIGTIFVWLSWLLNLYQSPRIGWADNILNGGLAVFVLTLTATQAAFFTEVTEQGFKDLKKLWLGLFLVLIIVSSITAVVASSEELRRTRDPDNTSIIWVSIGLFVLATLMCLFLYVVRLASGIGAEGMMEERVDDLTKKAKSESVVDGTKL